MISSAQKTLEKRNTRIRGFFFRNGGHRGQRPLNQTRGFSLLEVMVAIAILGMSLTVILSAQGGLSASNRSAANMGTATELGRCKMTEIEEIFDDETTRAHTTEEALHLVYGTDDA